MSRYGHAAELMRSVPAAQQLDYLVRQLGLWADLNPGLRELASEFARVSREISAGPVPDAALREILPYSAEIGRPGDDARRLTRIRELLYYKDAT